jgi:hypothetical protein
LRFVNLHAKDEKIPVPIKAAGRSLSFVKFKKSLESEIRAFWHILASLGLDELLVPAKISPEQRTN